MSCRGIPGRAVKDRLHLAYRGATDYSSGGALDLQQGERRVGLYTKSGLSWEAVR
jgi:hypothetical protein